MKNFLVVALAAGFFLGCGSSDCDRLVGDVNRALEHGQTFYPQFMAISQTLIAANREIPRDPQKYVSASRDAARIYRERADVLERTASAVADRSVSEQKLAPARDAIAASFGQVAQVLRSAAASLEQLASRANTRQAQQTISNTYHDVSPDIARTNIAAEQLLLLCGMTPTAPSP